MVVYICDGSAGLRLYKFQNTSLSKVKDISTASAFNIIHYTNNLLVKGNDGLYFYNATQKENSQIVGKILFAK